ncbi:MAG: hypothetical protein GF383_13435 [Candidatus Lokiarchaeota archaeon]|nr:hypothetical protein [Candidatus Lokiarchaeota archaeon]MBD3342200.1 hypothetical protein [Candidatus Lokiarchaeota archaeon]
MKSIEEKEELYGLYIKVKPILTTYIFELKKQWKKFVFFSAIAIAFVILLSYLPYALIPDNPLPATQAEFLQSGLQFISSLVIFASCFFFGGIICSEFSNKTGFITFPVINKYKLITGKFLGAYTLITGVMSIFYFALSVLSVFYYGAAFNYRIFYSFGIALLYALAVSSFVTFFSSFMNSVNMTIVSTILILLIAVMIVDSLIILLLPEYEPIHSLNHASRLVSYILEKDFPDSRDDRMEKIEFRGFTNVRWLTPTIPMGITIFLVYTGVCLLLASLIFNRRQL